MTEQRPTTFAGLEGSAATTPERRDGAVMLDRTAFDPGGGRQALDSGARP